MSFAHLHVHTAYSLLDGEGTIPKIIDRAKSLGQSAIAITDHGNMYGVIEFYEYAKAHGIHPVLGCEVYVAARTRFDKVHEYDAKSSHLILLAENDKGYKNLMNIVSAGFVDGFYYKPRVDMEILRKYSEGIIALSACMFGVLSRHILANNYDEAKRRAEEFIDIFGRNNYFIEIQDHGLPEQQRLNRELIALARELNLNLAATNDIHYVRREDAQYQDVLMCIQTGKTVDDDDRMKMTSEQLYVKSEDEMRELFGYIPEAIENTQKIADRCNVEITFGKLHLPEFMLPEGIGAFEYLKQLCRSGMKKHYGDDAAVEERLNYELSTIQKMGYVDYFLIVWDFIRYARENGIMVGPGRGSAAGSVVSYCLGITNVDPLKYGLIFERFLNPERVSMPDIDIDFCYERRGEVIDYVNKKYGEDHVAQIVTFGTMAARLAIRDVGRALNVPYAVVDSVAKQVPNELKMTIEKALKVNGQMKQLCDSDPAVKKLIDTAKELEGLPRHTSTHAAGVVITKEPVNTYVPLQKNDDVITTQFTMTTIERLGLLKMDFLGLRTLTVMRDAAEHIKENHGLTIELEELAFDDADVYKMISKGETDGVFQLESGGMRQFMRELMPNSLEDIIAGISLYRPGPMESIPRYIANKKNPSMITYKHPMLEHILNMTYGCIVYQEQVMQIVRELGGYSLGRADLVRRAMSKKKADVMEQERHNFIFGISDGEHSVEGAVKRGIDEETAKSIFDEMMDFASYAFNKSHAAAYAVVAYRTAWLKYHYPVEFFAALLTSYIALPAQVTKYIIIARLQGITVLPPDINKSGRNFTVDDGAIRFGLAAVKNIGGSVVDEIVNERSTNGEFRSFTDFCERMAGRKLTKRAVENLIKSGSFDGMNLKRSVLLNVSERVWDSAVNKIKTVMPGQMDMFSLMQNGEGENYQKDNFEDLKEFSHRDILAMEKECVGIYISGHPLDEYKEYVKMVSSADIISICENDEHRFSAGSRVRLAGVITKVRSQLTKRGDLMKYIEFEDLTGSIEVIVFPKQSAKFEKLLQQDMLAVITGYADFQDEASPKIRLEEINPFAPKKQNETAPSKVYLQLSSDETEKLSKIKSILKREDGTLDVCIYFSDIKKVSKASQNMRLNTDDERLSELRMILGTENVRLV